MADFGDDDEDEAVGDGPKRTKDNEGKGGDGEGEENEDGDEEEDEDAEDDEDGEEGDEDGDEDEDEEVFSDEEQQKAAELVDVDSDDEDLKDASLGVESMIDASRLAHLGKENVKEPKSNEAVEALGEGDEDKDLVSSQVNTGEVDYMVNDEIDSRHGLKFSYECPQDVESLEEMLRGLPPKCMWKVLHR